MLPNRPDFLTLYVDQPDSAGHANGPDSFQVKEALKKVDGLMNKLLAGLQIRNLTNCVNIIIVSDHGMSELNCERTVDLRKYINISNTYTYTGAFGRIRPKENKSTVDEILSKLQCQESHMRAYRKEELPVRLHYIDNDRIEPVIVDLDQRYQLVEQDVKLGDWFCSGGTHGYDNLSPDMKAIFFAYGPSFKNNMTIRPFLNIELYELMSELIDIKPQPNNGSKGSLHEILKHPVNLTSLSPLAPPPVAEVPPTQTDINVTNCSCYERNYEDLGNGTIENKTRFHLPFGIPQTYGNSENLLLIYNSDFILAYDTQNGFARWTAFTITKPRNSIVNTTICWAGDARFPNATCSPIPDGFDRRPLYPPEFSDDQTQPQAFYVTNSILKSSNYTNLLEDAISTVIDRKLYEKGPVNVILGPVFDRHTESIRKNITRHFMGSSPIPSHIFVIIMWCSTLVEELNECDSSLLNVQSFILPNFPFADNCESAENVIKKNGARIKEVEKITSISFFTKLSIYEAIRLRTSVVHLNL